MIDEDASTLLKAAQQLRNPLLFRECLVHLVARWKSSSHNDPVLTAEPRLYELVRNSYMRVCSCILDIEYSIRATVKQFEGVEDGQLPKFDFSNVFGLQYEGDLFEYYMRIYNKCEELEDHGELYNTLGRIIYPITMRHLRFPSYGYQPHLCYCATITDEELPWDTNKTDW